MTTCLLSLVCVLVYYTIITVTSDWNSTTWSLHVSLGWRVPNGFEGCNVRTLSILVFAHYLMLWSLRYQDCQMSRNC